MFKQPPEEPKLSPTNLPQSMPLTRSPKARFRPPVVAAVLAALMCVAALGEAHAASAKGWNALRAVVRKVRVGDLAGVDATLRKLQKKGSADHRATASFVLARVLAARGQGAEARKALRRARAIAKVHPPSWAWAEVEVLQAEGKESKALAALERLRRKQPRFRWAKADITWSRLLEKAASPKRSVAGALKLYGKRKAWLHLPQDELLARAARGQAAVGDKKGARKTWKKLLMKHPHSDLVAVAEKHVAIASLSDAERLDRAELLFARRAYERCRVESLYLWKKNYHREKVGYFLGKIGSERLRDDYVNAEIHFRPATAAGAPYAMFALSSYGIVLGKLKRTDEGVKAFDTWLKRYGRSVKPKRLVEAHYDRARVLRTGGRPLQAAADMKRFLLSHRKGIDYGKYWWFVGFWTYLGGKYEEAIGYFKPLTPSRNALVGGKARYWTAKAWDKLGKRDKAVKVMLRLYRNQPLNFYSGMAEEHLRAWGHGKKIPRRPDLSKVPYRVPNAFAGLPDEPAIATVRIAAHLGEYDTLRAVLKANEGRIIKSVGAKRAARLRSDLSDELEDFYSDRSRAWSRHRKSLRRYPTRKTVHHWRGIYPRAYHTHVVWAAKRYRAPEWMVYAHMLQESRYKPWMISHAPAYGLLELLDRTARLLALEQKEEYQLWMLMRPSHNIRWGTQYLGALYKKFDKQLPFAIGSYNGGPMLFEYHLNISKGLDFDVMVDDLGPHESRNYTRMVIGHFLRYLAIYEKPDRAAELRKQLLLKSWQPKWLKNPNY